jgi:hypothetical protein
MSMVFTSPSYRAAGSDLTIAVSPLGLIEASDDEFEMHGPRLSRYATSLAWYMGHHWAYKREQGEPQVSFNYVRALSEWMVNFTFGKAVIPPLLDVVWNQHNSKQRLLREIGTLGSVCGDAVVKVAFEPARVDGLGVMHEGRIRILPLNPANCFPVFHPHDRSRLEQMKLRYRFWAPADDGTKQVYTYTEIVTDDMIVEYINNVVISARPNDMAMIPYAWIANRHIPSSPWGLADIWDVIPLNREFNEKMTEFSDIINYYSAPVTVITGAKTSQLIRGSGRVWAGLPENAKVSQLETNQDFAGMLNYMALLKTAMHEITGVPEGALGKSQPISNTSGVALSIEYMSAITMHSQKTDQYGEGLERVNELIIRTCALYRPDLLGWRPDLTAEPEADQLPVLDPRDPLTYVTSCHWPPPLPVDQLVLLNEIITKMQIGIMSKRGALEALGEEFPNDVMAEIFEEQKSDAMRAGALAMLQASIQAAIINATGVVPTGEGGAEPVPAPANGEGNGGAPGSAGAGVMPIQADPNILATIATMAYGTKLPQRSMTGDSVST